MIKVLFDSRAWCLDVLPKMQTHFLESPELKIEAFSVYHNSLDFEKYGRSGDENLAHFYNEGVNRYTKADLVQLESKYGLINLWNVVYFDRFLKNKSEDYIIGQLSFYFFAWEKILSKHRPNYAVSETVVGAWNYILFGLSKSFNCQFLGFLFTKNSNKYFYSRDIFGIFPEMASRLAELHKRSLTESERQKAIAYSKEFNSNLVAPAYLKFFSGIPAVRNFFNPYRIAINLAKDVKTRIFAKNDYKYDYRILAYKRDFIRLKRIAFSKFFKIFEKPVYTEKYILFPLHFQPEASTEVCAAYYNDQYNVIVNLVRSLPFEYKLYVKEHYAVMGTKSTEFYKKIKALPNVRLIDPWEKIGALIHRASAVAVLTGTTGLEAIICRKPVIIFGHVFYDIYPEIFRVNNLEELPVLIRSALNFRPDEEKYLKYIYSYISSGYEGRLQGGNIPRELIPIHCNNLQKEIRTIQDESLVRDSN